MTTIRDHIKNVRMGWEIVEIGAHRFYKVPADQLLRKPRSGEAYGLLGPIMFGGRDDDDKLEFPGAPPLEGMGPYISAGIAVHTIGYADEWDYDRRVPLLFWRSGMAASERPEAVETTDIMPTLASVIGLPVDRNAIDGHCLTLQALTCPAR